jgi:hypothetical protein
MANDKADARIVSRLNHCHAFGDRQRHRLFAQDVAPCRRSRRNILDVVLMRRRNVDDLHARISAHVLDAMIGAAREVLLKLSPRFWAWIGPCDDFDALV